MLRIQIDQCTQRLKHKAPFMHSWMRKDDLRFAIDDLRFVPMQQEIQIDGAGAEAIGRGFPKSLLNALEDGEDFFGGLLCFCCGNGIQEIILVLYFAGGGAVDGGEADIRKMLAEHGGSFLEIALGGDVAAEGKENRLSGSHAISIYFLLSAGQKKVAKKNPPCARAPPPGSVSRRERLQGFGVPVSTSA